MNIINAADFGASSGSDSTTAIQKAIDTAEQSGGKVVVPEGVYYIRTLNLRGVTLELEKCAVLTAVPEPDAYDELPIIHNELGTVNPVLYSIGSDGLNVCGQGTIDLNARGYFEEERNIPDYGVTFTPDEVAESTKKYKKRSTQPIFLKDCTNILWEGVTVKDAPCWTFSFNQCRYIRILNINIQNDLTIPNDDGIHFCGCSDVFIHGCYISAGDDCIAFTGITDWETPCERIVVSDCIFESSSKAISIGYMHSIVRNVTITNCQVRNSNRALAIMSSAHTGLVENVIVSDCLLDARAHAGNWWGNGEPIVIVAVYHDNPGNRFPIPKREFAVNVRNVIFSNLICTAENVVGLVGVPEGNIENVRMDGIIYQRKPQKYMYLKGVGFIDCAPAPESPTVADFDHTWLYASGVRGLSLSGNTIENWKGNVLGTEIHDARS